MHGPGFNIKWGIKHPLQSTRESYLWARNESGYGRIRSALLVPFNWVAFTGVFHRG